MPELELPGGVSARPAVAKDSRTLGELMYECAQTYAEWQPAWTPASGPEANAAYVREHLAEAGAWMLTAERSGAAVGVVSYLPSLGGESLGDLSAPTLSYLKMLFVAPAQWGSGLASGLIADASRSMRAAGYTESYLWTMAGNGRARRFYEREGWRHDGGCRFHPGHRMDMVRYRTAPERLLASSHDPLGG